MLLYIPSIVLADEVTEDLTNVVVKNFLVAHKFNKSKVANSEVLNYSELKLARVYNLSPVGYIILTLDRNEIPIKAFSFERDFNQTSEQFQTIVKSRLYDLAKERDHFINLDFSSRQKLRELYGYPNLSIIALKTNDDYVILATNINQEFALTYYKQRWTIELLFSAFKKRGFNLEETHMSANEKIDS